MPGRTRSSKGEIERVAVAKAIGADDSLASVISGSDIRLPEMELYWMLLTKHPHVRSCAALLADAVSAEGYAIAPSIDGEDSAPIGPDDPRAINIKTFFRYAFANMTERQARWATTMDLCGFGVAYWRKKRAGRQIVGLERLDPRTISVKLSADRTAIDAYVMRRRNPDGQITNPVTKAETIAVGDMVRFIFEGGDPLMGMPSPLEALDLTIAHDFAARRFRESFFRRGMRPGAVLINKTAQKDQVEAAEKMLKTQKSGADNAYKNIILTGDWQIESLAKAGENDSDFIKGTGLNREEICGVYRVPVGLITFAGNALGSAGKGDDRDFFEEFGVLPIEEIIYETISLSLLRDEFDYDDVELQPKRRNRVRLGRFDAAVKAVKFGATGNEARVLVGLPPIDDPRYEMDTPLFIGSPTTGLAEAEPLATPPTPVTPGSEQSGATPPGNEGAAAQQAHDENEVTQKGARRFRGPRRSY